MDHGGGDRCCVLLAGRNLIGPPGPMTSAFLEGFAWESWWL